jgi:hypothetical protein
VSSSAPTGRRRPTEGPPRAQAWLAGLAQVACAAGCDPLHHGVGFACDRAKHLQWGATVAEVNPAMPGDDLLGDLGSAALTEDLRSSEPGSVAG